MNILDAETKVADLVTHRPSLSRLMDRLGIDYCCHGRRSLSAACADKALDVKAVLEQIAQSLEDPAEKTLQDLNLTQLVEHIVSLHHDYLRECLPLLSRQVERVAAVHGSSHPELIEVRRIFHAFSSEMLEHMAKEEQILFPAICRLERDGHTQVPLQRIIGVMETEHGQSGDALAQLRELTRGYAPPEGACTTYRSMLSGLAELEEDTHLHVHAENHILFPRALQLAT
ncbi:MAG: iron-sulfur cluster repair di-iron protein [Candidatus Eremiobacteraeota bacterium]|nr:iron-sulfur cluster repair di-iron protein [Candidatus Eremiobacteraeota bacterium]MCW5869888.1 iron-sulfur cluster repair di-iron protein [Candidatus Eremiobacteraeota bacterium]